MVICVSLGAPRPKNGIAHRRAAALLQAESRPELSSAALFLRHRRQRRYDKVGAVAAATVILLKERSISLNGTRRPVLQNSYAGFMRVVLSQSDSSQRIGRCQLGPRHLETPKHQTTQYKKD